MPVVALIDAVPLLPLRGALIGLDLGTKTIGVAASDPDRRVAAPVETIARKRFGIDAQRIRTISYGKDKPVDPGHDEAAWAKNRRGDFVLCTPK